MEQNPVLYERPTETVNISIDDVVVKKQKGHRRHQGEQEESLEDEEAHTERTYVHHTVAHVQCQEQTYCLTGQGVPAVLRMYLLTNTLLEARLQFFVDGQKTLHASILRAFSWLKNVTKCLWYGRVTSAIACLRSLPEEATKNPDALRVLIGYFERNRPYIPCYEVRKRVGLRNSSNLGEKMNDLLVSNRQKHNGMSWSVRGSSALAALETLKRNNVYQHWFEYHEIPFKQAA